MQILFGGVCILVLVSSIVDYGMKLVRDQHE